MEIINAIGRRKASVARVYLTKGEGKVTVNGKDLKEYFTLENIQTNVTDPFKALEIDHAIYDLQVNVKGGGFKGQSEAIRMAVSRALVKIDEDFKKTLRENKFLTRDAREVERKKYGKPKARKSFQFSKR
jgi:small subunit ribosomal protein S9